MTVESPKLNDFWNTKRANTLGIQAMCRAQTFQNTRILDLKIDFTRRR
jgi:hypothetical protein